MSISAQVLMDNACQDLRARHTHTSRTIERLLVRRSLAIIAYQGWAESGVDGARNALRRHLTEGKDAAYADRLAAWMDQVDWASVCVVLRSVVGAAAHEDWAHPRRFER